MPFEEATSKIQDNLLNKISHVTDTLSGFRGETRPERRMTVNRQEGQHEILEQAIKAQDNYLRTVQYVLGKRTSGSLNTYGLSLTFPTKMY